MLLMPTPSSYASAVNTKGVSVVPDVELDAIDMIGGTVSGQRRDPPSWPIATVLIVSVAGDVRLRYTGCENNTSS